MATSRKKLIKKTKKKNLSGSIIENNLAKQMTKNQILENDLSKNNKT
jgi:hypothetical protein